MKPTRDCSPRGRDAGKHARRGSFWLCDADLQIGPASDSLKLDGEVKRITIWCDGHAGSNLWRIDADGSGLKQLTFGEASYVYPDTNTNGTLVVQRVLRQLDIWRYPVDQSPADNVRGGVRITQQTSAIHAPSLAPNGDEIAYVSDSGSHANLWVENVKTHEARQITYETDPALRVGLPLWSPDGSQIAYFMSRGCARTSPTEVAGSTRPRVMNATPATAAASIATTSYGPMRVPTSIGTRGLYASQQTRSKFRVRVCRLCARQFY